MNLACFVYYALFNYSQLFNATLRSVALLFHSAPSSTWIIFFSSNKKNSEHFQDAPECTFTELNSPLNYNHYLVVCGFHLCLDAQALRSRFTTLSSCLILILFPSDSSYKELLGEIETLLFELQSPKRKRNHNRETVSLPGGTTFMNATIPTDFAFC